jgi:hypothetical protein
MNTEAVAAINAQAGHHGSTFDPKDVEEPKARHNEEDENAAYEGIVDETEAAMSFASSKAEKSAP